MPGARSTTSDGPQASTALSLARRQTRLIDGGEAREQRVPLVVAWLLLRVERADERLRGVLFASAISFWAVTVSRMVTMPPQTSLTITATPRNISMPHWARASGVVGPA